MIDEQQKRIDRLTRRAQFMIETAQAKHGDDYCADGMKDEISDFLSDLVPYHEQDAVFENLSF